MSVSSRGTPLRSTTQARLPLRARTASVPPRLLRLLPLLLAVLGCLLPAPTLAARHVRGGAWTAASAALLPAAARMSGTAGGHSHPEQLGGSGATASGHGTAAAAVAVAPIRMLTAAGGEPTAQPPPYPAAPAYPAPPAYPTVPSYPSYPFAPPPSYPVSPCYQVAPPYPSLSTYPMSPPSYPTPPPSYPWGPCYPEVVPSYPSYPVPPNPEAPAPPSA
ncbi:hypothetical protein HYH02_000654 [Chlamydomonas schloesseri]|uniref:Uncharacterized protein n=1 Tax=Chlamydomonas schloesseri TaxID=2026947 RepID=A0A836BCU3_9CHLO|nr:hypothetical protein HYH02_000654 [Chlamydomonas schloesseri]|eukprot:KAG2454822.1 hypothetical protein HYH02_000654 [Chlamydomonas schloesseri]